LTQKGERKAYRFDGGQVPGRLRLVVALEGEVVVETIKGRGGETELGHMTEEAIADVIQVNIDIFIYHPRQREPNKVVDQLHSRSTTAVTTLWKLSLLTHRQHPMHSDFLQIQA